MIANARMYAVTPQAEAAWRALLACVSVRAGVALPYARHPAPAPVSALWARPDCGCVFMCGYPYASAAVTPQLLAAPVPALARYEGRPVYFTEFIVRADAPAQSLAQTFGGRLACMLPESNSGYNAPRHYLMRLAPAGTRALYRPAAMATPTPREVIDAVLAGDAEAGVIDSYVMDLLRRYDPSLAAQLKTLALTPPAPIPVLMAAAGADRQQCMRVRGALLGLHDDAAGTELLASLGLARFVAVQPADYACLPAMANEAERANFALTDVAGAVEAPSPDHCQLGKPS
ncbi:PhnD/SsuA/transferrin family substrate-binding protein [Cupriavidus taiwanensis]|uniref:phosphate/phosphite/phosphonate ABC transporter substrate-binding protein n=1 Tax=Cupriavidus taiwanensis TaxID=164546 RepID=UPI000E184238|nr:PhnD/SsuA/transferrin family substrate-binding protein [Cupriavidus taiwanensis]SOZ26455.1 ABC-type transporter, periplasmic component [Cupriavidus taiwanensis]SPA31780.1 ABC-type transporter, periplasmic component [Cupriavidus taiwanensis]